MKIVSWNVNGIRAGVKNGLLEVIDAHKDVDIWCFQEVRADIEHLQDILPVNGYVHYSSSHAKKKGYSGVLTMSREKPLSVREGMGIEKFDSEGRILTTEFADWYLVNAYFPNTQHELTRLAFKQEFNSEMVKYLMTLQKKKPVIITGDFNVAHEEIDLANPKENERNAGFTTEERTDFTKLIESGFVDAFRSLHLKKVQYSWWTYRFGARSRNVGWRIDYFVISAILRDHVTKAEIWDSIQGSDHCPVYLEIQHPKK